MRLSGGLATELASTAPIGISKKLGGRLRRGVAGIAAPAMLLLLLFIGWEVAVVLLRTPAFILPRPSAILIELFTDWSLYQDNLLFTLQNVLIGFALAFFIAMALGFIVAHSRIANRTLYPILVASQTVPVIAIAPIFIIWFGYGILPKVITTALICFFPLTVNTITGYISVDEDQRTLFRAYNAGAWKTFAKLTFPSALPYIMSGVKVTVTLSVIGGVIGEWIGSEQGLGYLIIQSSAQIMTVRVFAAVTLLAWMGIILFLFASLVERLVTPWRRR
jgi:ABC-type nitrate/sulfonate/bicarbonate transport system permease component